ncbi:hypothetical protein OAO87_04790 [bacterium]|nr:hypothetical protein [bacterium]
MLGDDVITMARRARCSDSLDRITDTQRWCQHDGSTRAAQTAMASSQMRRDGVSTMARRALLR